jgi:hypothetical protein
MITSLNFKAPTPSWTQSPSDSQALVSVQHSRKQVSTSFLIDAKHFFQASQPARVWNKLVSLALTSRWPHPTSSHAEMNRLLQIVAVVAMNMPKLEELEIWNGGKAVGGVFRYQISDKYNPATITWRGNWDLSMESAVVHSWEAVAHKRGYELQVIKKILDADVVINSHGDAILYLRLFNEVVRPVSLGQIRKETSHCSR